jgi:hypothetical protein
VLGGHFKEFEGMKNKGVWKMIPKEKIPEG